jgi:putative addiction module component (TIGR02574 family)
MNYQLSSILKLSVPERILLVEAIWDSIANEKNNTYQLSSEQISILEEELASYSKNPDQGSSWEEIRKRILKK